MNERISSVFSRALKIAFWAFVAWLILRTFCFQVYRVPSVSMEPTYVRGDYICVNKLAYGARLPVTPLSLPFGTGLYLDWIRIPYLRLPGYAEVQRNDIIVFNLPSDMTRPVDQRQPYVKRCLGLPGDTVSISAGVVFVNGKQIEEPFRPAATVAASVYSPVLFPHSSSVKWNQDHFGPLFVPSAGSVIALDQRNTLIYENCIRAEGNTIAIKNDSCYINNRRCDTYTFLMDHYFTLGDNRNNSIDSRFWGFVPEDHLIGRSACIIHSAR